jgi:hypothetical protein
MMRRATSAIATGCKKADLFGLFLWLAIAMGWPAGTAMAQPA